MKIYKGSKIKEKKKKKNDASRKWDSQFAHGQQGARASTETQLLCGPRQEYLQTVRL